VHEERFEIIANQQHLADYKHRIFYTKIDHLQVAGDVTLSGVHWGGRYFEIPFQATFHGTSLKNGSFSGEYFFNKFFLHPQKGHRVFVYGIPKGDFSVNFIGATGDWLFHLNPRFSEKKVCEL
jgi:hypothetical protein